MHSLQIPADYFTVKPVLQAVEKSLFVGEHFIAFGSLQTTQDCPFYKAKPSKQLVQMEELLFEQVKHEDEHLTGTELTKA